MQIPAGFAMAMATITGIYMIRGDKRAVAITLAGDVGIAILGIVLTGLVGAIPLAVYGLVLLNHGGHLLALLGQALTSIILCITVVLVVPHLLQD